MLNRGQIELTGGISGIGVRAEGESQHVANAFGVHGQVGIDRRLNVGFGYGRFELEGGGEGFNSIMVGPRVGLIEDRVAVAVPLSFIMGDDVTTSETLMMHPTLLMTMRVGTRVDFNPSVRVTLPTCKNCDMADTMVGLMGGFGIRAVPNLTIRPEAGITFNPGESGILWTFGVGASFRSR
jgi:hypothetical protein